MPEELILDGEAFTPGLRSKTRGLLGPNEMPILPASLWKRIWEWRDRYAVIQSAYCGDGTDIPEEVMPQVHSLDEEGRQIGRELKTRLGADYAVKYYSAVRLVYLDI